MIKPTLEKVNAGRGSITPVAKLTGYYGGVPVFQVEWHNVQTVFYSEDSFGVWAYSSSDYLKLVDRGELARRLAEIKGAHI